MPSPQEDSAVGSTSGDLEQILTRNGESSKKRRMQSLTVDITITPCFGQTFCRAYAHFFSLPKEVGRIKNCLFSLCLFFSVNDNRLSIQQVREIRESAISKTVTSKAASFKTAKKTFKLLRKGREVLQLIATLQQKKSELPE